MSMSRELSRKIENMSFLCACLVVLIHIGWNDTLGSATWYIRQGVQKAIAGIAVPFFFVVSGYFLAAHVSEAGWWKSEVKKRVSSLLIPFLIWCAIAVVSGFVLDVVSDLVMHRPVSCESMAKLSHPFRLLGLDLSQYPALGALWYVRCLMIFVLLSPLVIVCVKWCPALWAVALAGASFLIDVGRAEWYDGMDVGCPLSCLIYGVSVRGLVYFSIGIYLQLREGCSTRRGVAMIALGAVVFLLTLHLLVWRAEIGPVSAFLIRPLALYGIWHFVPVNPLPDFVRGCSFPIFVMHQVVKPYMYMIVRHFPLENNGLVMGLVLLANGVVVPIFVCNILRKVFPNGAGILFGGRKRVRAEDRKAAGR